MTTTLLPAAVVLAVAALLLTRHHPSDHTRARLVLAVGLAWTTAIVLAGFGTIALASAVPVLAIPGGVVVWQHRVSRSAVRALALAALTTSVLALLRPTDVLPWLPAWPVLVVAALVAAALGSAHRRAMPIGAGVGMTLTGV